MYDHEITRIGIPAYFYGFFWNKALREIQIRRQVSIQLDNAKSRVRSQVAEVGRVEVRPGKFMILMRGDITKRSVDAIVNATNEDLKHIATVIAERGKSFVRTLVRIWSESRQFAVCVYVFSSILLICLIFEPFSLFLLGTQCVFFINLCLQLDPNLRRIALIVLS